MRDRSVSPVFEGTECPAVYQKLTDTLRDYNVNVDLEDAPYIHIKAVQDVFRSKGVPVESDRWQQYPDWFVLDEIQFDNPGKYVDAYLDAVGKIDRKATGRTPHDRAVDALLDRYSSGEGVENFDALVRELPVGDPDFRPRENVEDVELPWYREVDHRPLTDVDFMGYDSRRDLVKGVEVKTSDEPFEMLDRPGKQEYHTEAVIDGRQVEVAEPGPGPGRRKREDLQRERFMDAATRVRDQTGLEFDIEYEVRRVPDILKMNPLPAEWTGQVRFGEEGEFREFVEELVEDGRRVEPLNVNSRPSDIARST